MKRLTLLVFALLTATSALSQTTTVINVKSKVLGEERMIFIGTPRQYEQSADRYPVLYVTDAGAQFNHTLTTADFLARQRRMPPVIVVGITHPDRTHDLTPTQSGRSLSDGRPVALSNAGGAPKFREFIEAELIPYIDSNYRTAPYRIFSGHSFGGLFAVDTLFTRPSMFNGVIAISPTLDWEDDLVLRNARAFFKERKELSATLFVASGSEGALVQRSFDSMRGILKKQRAKGFSYDMAQYSDEDHGSVVLQATYFGLKKVFEDWPLPRHRENKVALGWEGIQAHYRHLTEKYGFPVAVPEDIANQAGYQFLQANSFREAINVLKANAEAYPESPNAYDSLGEAYEKSGQYELALESYGKAAKLGAERRDPNAAVFEANYERLAKTRR